MIRKNSAQTIISYAIIMVVVLAAVWMMKPYLTRVFQEKYRQSADTVGGGEQFDPGSASNYTSTSWYNNKEMCPEVKKKAERWEKEIETLQQQIDRLKKEIETLKQQIKLMEQRIQELEAQAARLDAAGYVEEAANLRNNIIPDLKAQIEIWKVEIKKREDKIQKLIPEILALQQKIDQLKAEFPQCFEGS